MRMFFLTIGYCKYLTALRVCLASVAVALAACQQHPLGDKMVAEENTYTAYHTYLKEVESYPFISVASDELPTGVNAANNITYVSYGERDLQLDVYYPQASTQLLPAIVLVHGGGWRYGYRENLTPLAQALAERGIVAATISYRLSSEALFPAAIADTHAAIRWLRENAGDYGIDAERIAVGGASAGGQIASLTGLTAGEVYFDPAVSSSNTSSEVQAVINIDGLSDFTSEAARYFEDDPTKNPSAAGAWLGGRYHQQVERWHRASPIFHVSPSMPPMLFINSAQQRFSVGQEEMTARMDAMGVVYRVHAIDNTPHTFWLFNPWLQPTADMIYRFLQEFLTP
ncbi:MAG TPA: alpha/beta hydrolase [Cellvibrionaceae bacterium]